MRDTLTMCGPDSGVMADRMGRPRLWLEAQATHSGWHEMMIRRTGTGFQVTVTDYRDRD